MTLRFHGRGVKRENDSGGVSRAEHPLSAPNTRASRSLRGFNDFLKRIHPPVSSFLARGRPCSILILEYYQRISYLFFFFFSCNSGDPISTKNNKPFPSFSRLQKVATGYVRTINCYTRIGSYSHGISCIA